MKLRLPLLFCVSLLMVFRGRAAEPAVPQYAFKQGEGYVYQIRIESQEANYTGVLHGVVTYTARTVNPHGFTLRSTGGLQPSRKMKDGRLFPPFGVYRVGLQYFDNSPTPPGLKFRPTRDVVFDTKGALIQQGDVVQDPGKFDVSDFIIEPFALKGESKWESSNSIVLVHEELEPVTPGGIGGISRLVRIKRNNLAATEKVSYSLAPGTNASTVIIKKQLEVKTRQMVGESPLIQITGQGEIVFDTKLGVPRSMEFKQTLAEAEENITRKTPMVLTYKLLEGKERDAALTPAASTNRVTTGTSRTPKSKDEKKPITDVERTQCLADLKSVRAFTKRGAAGRLAHAEATPKHRDEVSKALLPLLADTDVSTRAAGAKALGTWGNRDAGSALLKLIHDREFSVRWAVFDALVALEDKRAIEPIAKFLATGKDDARAVQTLRDFGFAAEDAVVKLLAENNVGTQREAAQLLKYIGTKKSLRDLEKLAQSAEFLLKAVAEDAIKAIQQREKDAKDAKK